VASEMLWPRAKGEMIMPLDVIPHFDLNYDTTTKGNLGGCCSKVKGDPKLFYNDRRNKLQFRKYEISCCSCYLGRKSEEAERKELNKTREGLDAWLQHHYQVQLGDVSEKAGVEIDQEITFSAFKMIHNQAIQEKLFREYHVLLDDAKQDLGLNIHSDRTFTPFEEQRIENWAKQNHNKNKYDNVSRKLLRQYGVSIEEAIHALELKIDPKDGLSFDDIELIESWAKLHNRNTDCEFVSQTTSVDDIIVRDDFSGRLEPFKLSKVVKALEDRQVRTREVQRITDVVIRTLAKQADTIISPRQIRTMIEHELETTEKPVVADEIILEE
jgi:ATP cone domain.